MVVGSYWLEVVLGMIFGMVLVVFGVVLGVVLVVVLEVILVVLIWELASKNKKDLFQHEVVPKKSSSQNFGILSFCQESRSRTSLTSVVSVSISTEVNDECDTISIFSIISISIFSIASPPTNETLF